MAAFLEADLVDEVSLLLVPGIDGRHDIPAVFDGVDPARRTAVPLKLKSVERRERDALWIRYEVVRSHNTSNGEAMQKRQLGNERFGSLGHRLRLHELCRQLRPGGREGGGDQGHPRRRGRWRDLLRHRRGVRGVHQRGTGRRGAGSPSATAW